MIKLTNILKEIEQDRIEEAGAKDALIGLAALAGVGGMKAQAAAPKAPVAITQTAKDTSTRTKTDRDGIIGSVTSKFKFAIPQREEIKISAPTKGVPSVVTSHTKTPQPLSVVKQFIKTDIKPTEMEEWNNFSKWLKEKGYAGTTEMDHGFDKIALDEYITEKKMKFDDFFITDGIKDIEDPDDYKKVKKQVERVQESIKSYRDTWIRLWKAGRAGIIIGGKSMVPGVDDDTVENKEWDANVF